MSGDFTGRPGFTPCSNQTQKMVLDATLLNTQHCKVRIKGKLEQSRDWSSTLPYTSKRWLLKREPSGPPRLRLPTSLFIFTFLLSIYLSIYHVYLSRFFYHTLYFSPFLLFFRFIPSLLSILYFFLYFS